VWGAICWHVLWRLAFSKTVPYRGVHVSIIRSRIVKQSTGLCLLYRSLRRLGLYICWEILVLITTFDPSESKNNRSSTASESRTFALPSIFNYSDMRFESWKGPALTACVLKSAPDTRFISRLRSSVFSASGQSNCDSLKSVWDFK